jgi:hypothetical protein
MLGCNYSMLGIRKMGVNSEVRECLNA